VVQQLNKSRLKLDQIRSPVSLDRLFESLHDLDKSSFMKIFEGLVLPFIITRYDSSIIYLNSAFERLTGYTREELVGRKSPYPWSPQAKKDEYILDLLQSQRADLKLDENCYLTKSGEPFWVIETISTLKELEYYLISWEDITQRKLTENVLQESMKKYHNLAERANDGICIIQDSKVEYCNSYLARMWGDSPESMIGMSFLDFIHPESYSTILDYYNLRQNGKEAPQTYQAALKNKQGEKIFVEINTGLIDYHGKPAELVSIHDISEHKKILTDLETERNKFQFFMNALDQIVNICDKDYNLIFKNKRSGLRLQKTVGQKCYQVIRNRDSICPDCAGTLCLKDGKPHSSVASRVMPDGKTYFVEIFAYPIKGAGGDIYSFIELVIDVSDRKRTEQKVIQSEAFNASILNNAPYPIFVTNPDTSIRFVNPAFEKLTGFNKDEVVGQKPPYPHIPPENASALQADLALILQAKKVYRKEIWFRKKNGEAFLVEVTGVPILDSTGEIECWLINWVDITERKRVEQKLLESEQFNSDLLKSSPHPIKVIDPDYSIQYVNPAFEKLTGYTSSELVGKKPPYPYWKSEDIASVQKDLIISFETDKEYKTERWFQKKNGELFMVESIGVSLRNTRGELLYELVTWEDITERKKISDKLEESYAQLQKGLDGAIEAVGTMSEARDPYTAGHQRRVSRLAVAIAREMGLPDGRVRAVQLAALLHDIGKISIPAELLSKPSYLSDIERILMQNHPLVSRDILKSIQFPWPICGIIVQHHERLDGSGYPEGLKGKQIVLEARILGVADVVEAMSSHRPYRPALGISKALIEISKQAGILYDEKVVEACKKLFKNKLFKFE
jgi:PAS domain S-box-containing protein/putative nucleotidyltransferase with HDIG domain